MNDGFPQLKFENAVVIEKLFEEIRKNLTPKTNRVNFDNFIELVCSFNTKDIDKKVSRFFNLVDEDGNGELSQDEIMNLCQRSFQPLKEMLQKCDADDEQFFDELADFFTRFIFEKTGVDIEDEITPDELKEAILENKEDAELLEMFCGDQLINV